MAQSPQDIGPIYKGEDVTLAFTHQPSPTDITGWTISFRLKQQLADTTPLLTINATITTAAAGLYSVALTAAQTLSLSAGTYFYDVWRTDGGSAAALALGQFGMKGSVKNQ